MEDPRRVPKGQGISGSAKSSPEPCVDDHSRCLVMSLDAALPGLVPAAHDGSHRTFETLYRQISPRLHGYLRAAEPAEAEDLAADVWLAIAGQLDTFVGDENGFQALVFTIARRRVTDHRRRRYRRRTDPVGNETLADHQGADHPESQVIDSLNAREAIEELVRRLPAAQADVIRLRVLAGLTVDEASVVLERSPGAVRILHHRALKRLRDDARPLASDWVRNRTIPLSDSWGIGAGSRTRTVVAGRPRPSARRAADAHSADGRPSPGSA